MKQKLDLLEIIGLARLHELFSYYPNSGLLVWKIDVNRRVKAGDVAGTLKRVGYRQIKVGGKSLYAHRIAWYMTHGRIPKGGTNQENSKNKKKPSDNTSGVVGVYWATREGQWRAKIMVDGKYKNLGCFDDFDEAVKARKAAEKELGFHHNHGKR